MPWAAFSAKATHAALGGVGFTASWKAEGTTDGPFRVYPNGLGKNQPKTVVVVAVVGLVVVAVAQATVVTVVEVAAAPKRNTFLTGTPDESASEAMTFHL